MQFALIFLDKRITACSLPSIAGIVSEETGVAEIEIPLLEGAATLKLYPGNYPFNIRTERVNCTININVKGDAVNSVSL